MIPLGIKSSEVLLWWIHWWLGLCGCRLLPISICDLKKKTDFLKLGSIGNTHILVSYNNDLFSPRGWRGIGLAVHGCNGENNYLLINDLYWQPGGAHLQRWETSPGLKGFYSRLNYFSLAIVLSRGACVMSTICGLKRRWKSFDIYIAAECSETRVDFPYLRWFQKLSYSGTASPFTSD